MDPPEPQRSPAQREEGPASAEKLAGARPVPDAMGENRESTSERPELDASQDAVRDWDDDGDSAIGSAGYA